MQRKQSFYQENEELDFLHCYLWVANLYLVNIVASYKIGYIYENAMA